MSRVEMIHEDCKECEMLDLNNPEFPCKLEESGSILRCTILHNWCKTEGLKSELYDV